MRDPQTAATRPAGEATLAQDRVLDRYRLVRRLGRGGNGTVWEAIDERLERPVAVKAIPRGDGGLAPRAEREGRVAARLSHPGIVALYELGDDDDAVYLVSELVPGQTMAELASAGALSDRDTARIGLALCSALAHAHARGVIHRDIKPQNVIVVAEPAAGAGFAKLTDFGVAHLVGEDPLTRTGDVVGTLAYMAPEQAEGGRVTDAADVYSLALVLHEAWSGDSRRPAAERLSGRPPPPLARLRRDLPRSLCETIDAALDPRPDRRPPLDRIEAELLAAERALSDAGGLVEPATRRRVGVASAAAALRPSRTARLPLTARASRVPAWLARAAAAAAAGALVVAALELLGAPRPPVAPLGAGAGAAVLVAVLPRIGWIAAATAVVLWLASPAAGLQGTALVLAAALGPVPLLLARAGVLWSVPALAPLLGAVGLAPLFVAVAGLAPTAWRRAALGALGVAWLAAAELLTGEPLLFGTIEGTAARGVWEGSALSAARDAVGEALLSPLPLVALVWAALAVALGILVRGRGLPFDVAGAAIWAIAVVAAHAWLARLLAGQVRVDEPDGLVAAAVLGSIGALAVAAASLRARAWEGPSVP